MPFHCPFQGTVLASVQLADVILRLSVLNFSCRMGDFVLTDSIITFTVFIVAIIAAAVIKTDDGDGGSGNQYTPEITGLLAAQLIGKRARVGVCLRAHALT